MRKAMYMIASYIPNIYSVERKERGATMVEYAIMVARIAIAAIVIIAALGQEINNAFQGVKDCIADPTAC